MLAALAGDLAGADPAVVTLEAMEELVAVRGRELLRAVLQYGLDARAAAEVRLRGVTGTEGVPPLFVRDAALNLPPRGYSWHLQRLAAMTARDGAYALAQEFVLAATGV